jgi:hypothetical protein
MARIRMKIDLPKFHNRSKPENKDGLILNRISELEGGGCVSLKNFQRIFDFTHFKTL